MNSNSSIDKKDITADDLIGMIPWMSDGLIEEYKKFDSCIEDCSNCCRKYHGLVSDHRNSIGNFPNRLKSSLHEVVEEISKNKCVLEEKKSEVEQLKKIAKDLDTSISQNEQSAESLRQKNSNLRDKMEKLQEKRDKILVYKLLTNTNFCYEGANVSGYVFDQKTRKIECFDFNPEKLSQKEITEHLYGALKKVSHGTREVQNAEMDQMES